MVLKVTNNPTDNTPKTNTSAIILGEKEPNKTVTNPNVSNAPIPTNTLAQLISENIVIGSDIKVIPIANIEIMTPPIQMQETQQPEIMLKQLNQLTMELMKILIALKPPTI